MLQQMEQRSQQVAVWFVNAEPARLVVGGQRWKVVSNTVREFRGEPSFIPPMLTHAPSNAVIGYEFVAVSIDDVQRESFSIRADGDRWLVN